MTLLVSGVSAVHADVTAAAFEPFGFVERERRVLDGWAASILEHDVIRLAIRVRREDAELVLPT